MRSSKILSLLTLVFAFCVMIQVIPVKAETYIADKEWSKLKPGDVIYFDNSEVEWDEVYIYIWGKKDDNTTTDTYKEWKNSDKMEKVEGEEKIYKFIVPDTMAVDTYNMIIFKNGNGDSVEQTIDLGFIEEGFAYKIEKNKTGDNNKKIGYWYLYDKSDITEHLDGAKKSQQDKQYYKNYNQKLDELITEIETKLESEIILYEEQEDGHGTGKYYIEIDTPIEEMKKIVDSLEVNDELLRDKIKEIEEKLEQNKDKYTDETVKELESVLEDAKEILESGESKLTVEYLKQSLTSIDEATNNLEEKVIENNTNTLGEVTKPDSNVTTNNNPKTYDGVIGYLVLGIVSLGLVGLTVKKYLVR